MFNRIAPWYDVLNHTLSLGIDRSWRKKMIRELVSHQPDHLLDVATGTGDVAFEALKHLDVEEIIGLDLSEDMLELARSKAKKQKGGHLIRFEQGESEEMRFEDERFDAVTAAFGVRNFHHLDRGLSEMYRVLKPGGQVVILEFSNPKLFPFKQLYNGYFKYLLPLIGRITSRDPRAYSYLYESVRAFPDYEEFLERLRGIGYKNCRYKSLTLGICCIYLAEK